MERFFSWRRTIAFNREGPLGPFMDELAQHFVDGGYCRCYVVDQLRIAAEFSHWLLRRRVTAPEIEPDHVERFLRHRARTKVPRFRHPVIFALIYDLLRRKGLIADVAPAVVRQTPVDKLISEFRLYLVEERHLANATVIHYAKDVADWLKDRFGDGPAHWRTLSVADMTDYITRRASVIARKTAKTMVSALRSYLQFARYRGYVRQDLASSIPPFAHWSQTSIHSSWTTLIGKKDVSRCVARVARRPNCRCRMMPGRRSSRI
jgi:integrase/recombinase XerD